MIKLSYEERSDRNTLFSLRYYKVVDMEDICIEDHDYLIMGEFHKLNKYRGYLNPDTTLEAHKKQMVMYDD